MNKTMATKTFSLITCSSLPSGFWLGRCKLRFMHGRGLRGYSTIQHNTSMDCFWSNAVDLVFMKDVNIRLYHEPLAFLKWCCKNESTTISQKLLSCLLTEYIYTRNCTDAFKLFLNPELRIAFTGKVGLAMCLRLMMFMYKNERHINVLALHEFIIESTIKDPDISRLADALYVATILQTNQNVLNVPPPEYNLSRYYIAVHHLILKNYETALEVIQMIPRVNYKQLHFNILLQIHASTSEVTDVLEVLRNVAVQRVTLFSDTKDQLCNLQAEGARGRQLSRHILWATSCGLFQTDIVGLTVKQSLETLVMNEVVVTCAIKERKWDDIEEWAKESIRTKRYSSS